MKDKRWAFPIAGLVATIAVAGYTIVQLYGQSSTTSGDFTNAATATVRDAQGVELLRGQFVVADEQDDDVERKATLAPTGADADAAGDAEVEFSKTAPDKQEVEFSVRNVQPGVALTFVIDGIDVATATTDERGRAEVELDIQKPGTAASR